MAAPTLLDYAESNWADTSTSVDTTDDLDWAAATDVIVVLGATEDNGLSMATPTGTGITLSALSGLPTNTASSCKGYGWSGSVSGNGNSVLTSTNGASGARGLAAWAFSGSGGLGTPVVSVNTNLTHNMTVAQDSTVVMVLADWNATADVTVTTVPAGGTIREATQATGGTTATFLVIEWANQAAGTRAYGVSAWTGTGTITKVSVEVLGTAGGGVAKDGQGSGGAGGYGAAVKVAPAATTRATAAAGGAATARKVVALTGRCSGGPAGRAVAVRVAPEQGRSTAAGGGAGTARRVAPVAARTSTAAGGAGTGVKRATPVGRVLGGAAGYATARHVAVVAALSTGGVGGYGDATGATPPRPLQGAGGGFGAGFAVATRRAPVSARTTGGAGGFHAATVEVPATDLTGTDVAGAVLSPGVLLTPGTLAGAGDTAPVTLTGG